MVEVVVPAIVVVVVVVVVVIVVVVVVVVAVVAKGLSHAKFHAIFENRLYNQRAIVPICPFLFIKYLSPFGRSQLSNNVVFWSTMLSTNQPDSLLHSPIHQKNKNNMHIIQTPQSLHFPLQILGLDSFPLFFFMIMHIP